MQKEELLTLVFTFKTKPSFSSLVQEGRIKSFISIPIQGEKASLDNVFPRQAIRIALGLDPNPDEVIFLGKPLLLMDRLLDLHGHFFPFSAGEFCRSFMDLLSVSLQLEQLTLKTIVNRAVKRCRKNPGTGEAERKKKGQEIRYVLVSDALMSAFHERFPEQDTIAVCLTDDYCGPMFSYYVSEKGEIKKKFEEKKLPGLGHLLFLYQHHNTDIEFYKAIRKEAPEQLSFSKRFFRLKGSGIEARQKKEKEETASKNTTFVVRALEETLGEVFKGQKGIFVHDCPLPREIIEKFPHIQFEIVGNEQKILAACQFRSRLN